MQKVIIADDEMKICQLIEKLADWPSLDMEVVGVACNGLEAFEKIQEYNPDIVITDIRMPGMDGLEMIRRAKELKRTMEFIIVSGYRHFEYAQSAIKYGVSDYLLKPVKKEELNHTLSKMREAYLQRTEQLTFEERVLLALKNDVGKVRTGFFSGILYPKDRNLSLLPIETINMDYHYTFRDGIFQIISIKLDGVGEVLNSSLKFMMEKVSNSITLNLREVCYDLELYFENSRSYCLLNYDENNKKAVRKGLKAALEELALQESILEGLHVTIGCGNPAACLEDLRNSMKMAVRAIEQRILAGTDRVIEGVEETGSRLTDSELFHDFNRNMNQALEGLDTDLVSEVLDQLEKGLMEIEGISGHEILQMTKEVCNLYLFYMRNHQLPVENGDYFIEAFNIQANGYYEVDKLFSYLKQEILKSLKIAADEKKQVENKPIRLAKQYIQNNYQKPLTLEEVSEAVGFNASYFSSLFKKETGNTFLEYVSEVRMTHAKQLLKDTNYSIAMVCEQVGYSDVKHFTKSFVKYCSLKPNEYRKLYS